MSMSPRLSVAIFLSLVALTASCSVQPETPTSPTGSAPLIDGRTPLPTEYFVTLADETPVSADEPAPAPTEPAPTAPAPEPLPAAPVPAPPPCQTCPGWTPGGPPRAAPGAPVPTPPSTHFRVSIKVDPEPVSHSGVRITDTTACRDLRYTWFYDQKISTDTGIGVTLTERENFFDGIFVSRSGQTIQIAGNSGAVVRTRWCSGHPKFHYAQTRYRGRDDAGEPITISGPWVRLLAP